MTSLNDILAQHGFQKDMSDMIDSDPGALQTPSPSAPVLRSPDAASVQSQPKVSPPSAGSLPMRRAKPGGGNAEAALGPEKLAELKKEVSEAKKDNKLQRKGSKATIEKGFVPEKVKPEVTLDVPSAATVKRKAESSAARQYLESLATPANPGAQKKPAANTNRTRKAKAKAKSKASSSKKDKSHTNKGARAKSRKAAIAAAANQDNEEILDLVEDDHEGGEEENGGESDSILSQETLVLPGKGDDGESDGDDPQNEPVAPDVPKSEPTQNMRELYWKVVHEAQTRIRKAHPKMKAAEVLKLARAEWNEHPERLNIIKNMSKNDLSKRRLMPDASKKTRVRKTQS